MEIRIENSLLQHVFTTPLGYKFYLERETGGDRRFYIVSTYESMNGQRMCGTPENSPMRFMSFNWYTWVNYDSLSTDAYSVFRLKGSDISHCDYVYPDMMAALEAFNMQVIASETITQRTGNPSANPDWSVRRPRPATPFIPHDFILEGVIGDCMYSVKTGYHGHSDYRHNYMTHAGTVEFPYWVGIELEVECESEKAHDALCQSKSNWFYCERDGSLSDGHYGVEIITIKMNPNIASRPSTWEGLLSYLSNMGVTSYENGRCGLHVHILRSAFGRTEEEIDSTVGKLIHLYNNELGAGGFGGDYVRHVMQRSYQEYCRSLSSGLSEDKRTYYDFVRQFGASAINKKVEKIVFKDISKGYDSNRYVAINLQNENTIEFRQARGTLKLDSFLAKVQFCIALVEFSRKTSMKGCTRENFFNKIRKMPDGTALRKILNL